MTLIASLAGTLACSIAFFGIAYERARAFNLTLRLNAVALLGGALVLAEAAVITTAGKATLATPTLLASVVVCGVADLQTGYIFDRVLLCAAATLLAIAVAAGHVPLAITGAALAFIFPALLYAGSGGRAIGFGDVKLAALIGLALGPAPAMRALWASAVVAGATATAMLVMGRAARRSSMPFGPFLALGACCAVWTMP